MLWGSMATNQMFSSSNGDRADSTDPDFLILMMDSRSVNSTAAVQAALLARSQGITIIVVRQLVLYNERQTVKHVFGFNIVLDLSVVQCLKTRI